MSAGALFLILFLSPCVMGISQSEIHTVGPANKKKINLCKVGIPCRDRERPARSKRIHRKRSSL